MDIRLVSGSYKSLTEFEWLDVPDFAIVTGPNGSGKTQMLELIAGAAGLLVVPEAMTERSRQMQVAPMVDAKVQFSHALTPQHVVFLRSQWPALDVSADLQSITQQAYEAWYKGNDQKWDRLWSIMEEKIGRPRSEITQDEFLHELPPNFPLLADTGMAERGVPELFVSYLHSIEVLQREGRSIEEIEAELSPLPWELLNDILASASLPYRVVTPTLPRHLRFQQHRTTYSLVLEDKGTGRRIFPSDLSAGERVMFQVALWYFSFAQRPEHHMSGDATRLLLLDEPDAHLHPALTRAFLHVIRSELVEKHGVRVIMTTHSPSTVALAPDASIFVMSRKAPRIRRAESRWEGVGQLTAGFLTIGSESKCVFVEDEDDRDFYSTLQELLTVPSGGPPALDASRSILFIPASAGHPGQGKGVPSGGRKNVEKWVKMIPSTQIAGIVDLDDAVATGERIHQLRRHSLENYLLDPLFLFAVLLEDKKAPAVPGIGLSVYDARRLLVQDPAILQTVADVMLAEMRSLHPSAPATTDRQLVQYHNGPEIQLERWFIESSVKLLLQPLRTRFELPLNNYGYLTSRYRLMEIVPSELVGILQAIQAA